MKEFWEMYERAKALPLDDALKLLLNDRGKLVIGGFIFKGILSELKLPQRVRETSNMEEATVFLKSIFPLYITIRKMDEATKEKFGLRYACLKCEHIWVSKGNPVICPKCKTKSISQIYG